MSTERLVSFDLRADFGFFKKPDYNDGLLLSYNMIHKPALLGILGAIIGLSGYQKKGELPEYYQKLKDIPLGIEPLLGYHERGNFQKTSVKYTNTVGYANLDGNLLVEETMLIRPAYRCYVLLNLEQSEQEHLYRNLKEGKAEYIPYLGKNEFQASWLSEEGENTFREYAFQKGTLLNGKFKILNVFRKTINIRNNTEDDSLDNYNPFELNLGADTFIYFERLPATFMEFPMMIQYDLESFTYTNLLLKENVKLPFLYYLIEPNAYVQLT